MSIPQFSDEPTEILTGGGEKRNPDEFIPWDRIAEVKTPRGTRPGLVLIVRPQERIPEASIRGEKWRRENPDSDWKTLVIADIAILDPIPPGVDQYSMPLPPFPPGSQWRNQLVFPGMLNKAWRDKIGGTLIGVVYLGEAKPMANGSMGKPPFLWRSLAQDEQQVRRGQGFMVARPEFLIPIPRVQPQQAAQDTYVTAQQDPWAQPLGQQSQYAQPQYQQPVQQYQPGWQQDPNQQYPMMQQQPVQAAPAPQTAPPQGYGYQQPDPWASAAPQHGHAQAPAQPVAHAQQPVQQHPQQVMNTLEQIKAAAAAATNAQGQPQSQDPPF